MNRISLIVLIILSSITLSLAQKVKIKDQKIKVKYLQLPSIGFDNSVSSYSIDIASSLNALQNMGYSESDVRKSLKIDGYNLISHPLDAQVILNIIGPSGSSLNMKRNDHKRDDGTKYQSYYYSVDFSGSIGIKVVNQSGELLLDDVIRSSTTKKSSSYATKSKLKKEFNSSSFYLKNRKGVLKDLLKKTSRRLRISFGFIPNSEKTKIRRLAHKKHPAYSSWKAMESTVEAAFEKLVPTDNMAFKEAIQPAIDFWKTEQSKYDFSHKESKKLKFACLYNLAVIYTFTDEYEKSKNMCQLIIDGGHKAKDGKKLLKKVEKITKDLKRLGRTTRFFVIDVDENFAAEQAKFASLRQSLVDGGDIRAFPEFATKLGVQANSIIATGTIYPKQYDKSEGYWVYENKLKDSTPDFRYPRNLRFGYLSEEEINVISPIYSEIDSIRIDKKTFAIMDVTVGSGLIKLNLKNGLVEVIKDFEKTTLVHIHPSTKVEGLKGFDQQGITQVAIYDKKKDRYYPPTGVLGGLKKGMKKIVGDCDVAMTFLEDLKNKRKEKGFLDKLAGFENNEAIQHVLKLYDECSQ